MKQTFDDSLYRKGVGIILVNKDKKVFLGKRKNDFVNSWQLPQGGIEENEDEEKAAYRELLEEVGINNAQLIIKSADYYYYNIPVTLRKKIWNNKYIGQKQRWFLFNFLGNDNDININYHHDIEFSKWKWEEWDNIVSQAIHFKRNLYRKLIKEFGQYIV